MFASHQERILEILGFGVKNTAEDPCHVPDLIKGRRHDGDQVFLLSAKMLPKDNIDEISTRLRRIISESRAAASCDYQIERGETTEISVPIGIWAAKGNHQFRENLLRSGIAVNLILRRQGDGLLHFEDIRIDTRLVERIEDIC